MTNAAPSPNDARNALLRLTLTPGVGPILIRRAIKALGSPQAVLAASPAALEAVKGIGAEKARAIADARAASAEALREELELAAELGARIVCMLDEDYPPLLHEITNSPPVLYFRGSFDPALDRYSVAIIGSRGCTQYGVEQAERLALALAQAGLTVVSGGARGIDSAAHRGALRARGRTVAVLGCGLAHCYPPENADLFEQIVRTGGAVVSELPLRTPPVPDNFPARNRIISALSLGVLVIEAGKRSGALITARLAGEEHGREVMAIPGRIDSPASEGSLELLKSGGAAVVTSPADVIDILEQPARHVHSGVHADLFTQSESATAEGEHATSDAAEGSLTPRAAEPPVSATSLRNLSVSQRTLVEALVEPKSFDDLARQTGLDPGVLRSDATVLEIRRLIVRQGSLLARRA